MQIFLNPNIENRFSKSESGDRNEIFSGIKNRKSIFEIRFEKNEIRKLNMKLKFSESKFENRFSKNVIRNSRFPKIFKNRFENSESVLERMIYKNALKKKTNHNFEKMITQDDL